MRYLFLLCSGFIILSASAQKIKQGGIVIGIAMGYAQANGIMTRVEPSILYGKSFQAEAGYRINHRFAGTVGVYYWVEGNGMFRDNTYTNEPYNNNREHFLLNGYYFPLKKSEGFIRFGLGGGNYVYEPTARVGPDIGDSTLSSFSQHGFSCLLGAGWLLRISPKVVLKPEICCSTTSLQDIIATTGQVYKNNRPSTTLSFSIGLYLFCPVFTEPPN